MTDRKKPRLEKSSTASTEELAVVARAFMRSFRERQEAEEKRRAQFDEGTDEIRRDFLFAVYGGFLAPMKAAHQNTPKGQIRQRVRELMTVRIAEHPSDTDLEMLRYGVAVLHREYSKAAEDHPDLLPELEMVNAAVLNVTNEQLVNEELAAQVMKHIGF